MLGALFNQQLRSVLDTNSPLVACDRVASPLWGCWKLETPWAIVVITGSPALGAGVVTSSQLSKAQVLPLPHQANWGRCDHLWCLSGCMPYPDWGSLGSCCHTHDPDSNGRLGTPRAGISICPPNKRPGTRKVGMGWFYFQQQGQELLQHCCLWGEGLTYFFQPLEDRGYHPYPIGCLVHCIPPAGRITQQESFPTQGHLCVISGLLTWCEWACFSGMHNWKI